MEYLVNELLERRAAKVARSVLRGGRQSNLPSLPDRRGQGIVAVVRPPSSLDLPWQLATVFFFSSLVPRPFVLRLWIFGDRRVTIICTKRNRKQIYYVSLCNSTGHAGPSESSLFNGIFEIIDNPLRPEPRGKCKKKYPSNHYRYRNSFPIFSSFSFWRGTYS